MPDKERYQALVFFYLFSIIHQNFMKKSAGGADSLGNQWEPLAESTRIYKPLMRGEKKKFPKRKTLSIKQVRAERNPPILILTHRLERSLRPGRVVGDRYIPPPEQIAEINKGRIKVGSEVPYSREVARLRPPIPRSIQPWIEEARRKALMHLEAEERRK